MYSMNSFVKGTLLRSWLRSRDAIVILSTPMKPQLFVGRIMFSRGCRTPLLHTPSMVTNIVMKNTIVPQSTPERTSLGLEANMYIPAAITNGIIPCRLCVVLRRAQAHR